MFLDVRDLTITLKTGEEIAKDISFSIDGGEIFALPVERSPDIGEQSIKRN